MTRSASPPAAGIGLRAPHLAEVRARRPEIGFLEVHSENFFAEGGAARAALLGLRADHAVSLHGVGLSLGSATGLDAEHLARLAALVAAVEPVRVSDHASFARVDPGRGRPVWHGADLLPVAFTPGSLAVMVANVQRVQERLGRPLLVENLSASLAWADDTMAEPDFLAELARRSGCGLLLDVNNLVVNAQDATLDVPGAMIQISTALHANGIILAVSDNGPGFPPEMLARAFEPYVTGKTKGTGLGLAVVKKIIEEHGGTVHAENLEPHGARLCVTLPLSETKCEAVTS